MNIEKYFKQTCVECDKLKEEMFKVGVIVLCREHFNRVFGCLIDKNTGEILGLEIAFWSEYEKYMNKLDNL